MIERSPGAAIVFLRDQSGANLSECAAIVLLRDQSAANLSECFFKYVLSQMQNQK